MQDELITPYLVRAQFEGKLKLLCPWCGSIRFYRLNAHTWRIRCKNMYCRRVMTAGINIGQIKRANKLAKRPLDITFPAGRVHRYDGMHVHHAQQVEDGREERDARSASPIDEDDNT